MGTGTGSLKIIVASNGTLVRNKKPELDTSVFYIVQPLVDLGHKVYFYDTVSPKEPDFVKIVESLNPDLIFCCFTGNPFITPFEPWEAINKITKENNIKTFNWFCDDTWRFDNFSSKACWHFNHCSTVESTFIDKFKKVGYDNIMLSTWHANESCFPDAEKDIDISFVGGMNKDREAFFSRSKVPVKVSGGLDIQELFKFYSRSKIGINLSINANDPDKKTQMKLRVFELAAAKCTILTEYHEDLERCFVDGEEMLCFSGIDDFEEKVSFLLSNPERAKNIALNGYNRFMKDHESKVVLTKLLEELFNER